MSTPITNDVEFDIVSLEGDDLAAHTLNMFVSKLDSEGVVSRADVASLEEAIPGIVTVEMPVNSFTTQASGFGIEALASHLGKIAGVVKRKNTFTPIDLVKKLNSLGTTLSRMEHKIMYKRGDMVIDDDKLDAILNGKILATYDGPKLVDLVDMDIDNMFSYNYDIVPNVINAIDDREEADRTHELFAKIIEASKANGVHIPLISSILEGNLSIANISKTSMTTPTLRDVLNNLVVTDALETSIKAVKSEVSQLLISVNLSASRQEDGGSTAFHGELSTMMRSVDYLSSIINDEISFDIISFLIKLTHKNANTTDEL